MALRKFKVHREYNQIKVKTYYEYIPKTLEDVIVEKSVKKDEFTERELLNLIYGVETGLKVLYFNQIKHGCINMETILYSNNTYKITDVSTTTCMNKIYL